MIIQQFFQIQFKTNLEAIFHNLFMYITQLFGKKTSYNTKYYIIKKVIDRKKRKF